MFSTFIQTHSTHQQNQLQTDSLSLLSLKLSLCVQSGLFNLSSVWLYAASRSGVASHHPAALPLPAPSQSDL